MATLDLTGSDHLLRLPTSFNVSDRIGMFAARFDYRYQGYAVVAKETSPGTWAVSAYPGLAALQGGGDGATSTDDQTTADYIFYGGETYTVTDANLQTALSSAGYTIS